MTDNWRKYKGRIDAAHMLVDKYQQQLISKRAEEGTPIEKAVQITNYQATTILHNSGAIIMTPRGYRRMVTKEDWKRFGYPEVKRVSDVPLFQMWKKELGVK